MITWAAAAFAGTLSGAVTDMSGAPVVDARVFAYDTRFTYGATRTDGSGRFVLGLPDEGYRVRVVPAQDSTLAERWWPEGYVPCEAERIDLVDDGTAEIEVVLEPGAVLSGRLVDTLGGGVPGCQVTADALTTDAITVDRSTLTDADGFFELRGLPPVDGSGASFRLRAEGVDLPDQWLGATYQAADARAWEVVVGGPIDVGTHELLPGVGVSGSVLGPMGAVEKALVTAYSPSQLVEVTAVEGSYAVMGLPPGEVLTWARATGLATTYLPNADRPDERVPILEEGAMVAGLDIEMPEERVLSGQLVGEGPMSGARVTLFNDARTIGRSTGVDDLSLIHI